MPVCEHVNVCSSWQRSLHVSLTVAHFYTQCSHCLESVASSVSSHQHKADGQQTFLSIASKLQKHQARLFGPCHDAHVCVQSAGAVFGVLLTQDAIVAVAHTKAHMLHPHDLLLLANLIRSNDSFRQAQTFTPICLPHFDSSAFLHAYVQYLHVVSKMHSHNACVTISLTMQAEWQHAAHTGGVFKLLLCLHDLPSRHADHCSQRFP